MQTTVYTSDEEFMKTEGDRGTTQSGKITTEEKNVETTASRIKATGVSAGLSGKFIKVLFDIRR